MGFRELDSVHPLVVETERETLGSEPLSIRSLSEHVQLPTIDWTRLHLKRALRKTAIIEKYWA